MAIVICSNIDRNTAESKKENLISGLKKLESLVVAFSGGVDSTFLLEVASRIPGLRLAAVTASSILHPNREKKYAAEFAEKSGIRHILFETYELDIPAFVLNGKDRCYHCKRNMFTKLLEIAENNGFKQVAHGANIDDLHDFRPGFRAADESGVIAPLIDAGLNKEEIRFLSKEMGLSTWNIPAMACLATRIPYGSPVTENKLLMIEKAEDFLMQNGFIDVRVRHYGAVAVIEVKGQAEMRRICDKDIRTDTIRKFREIGFEFVSLDLEGFISGKMNRTLASRYVQEGNEPPEKTDDI